MNTRHVFALAARLFVLSAIVSALPSCGSHPTRPQVETTTTPPPPPTQTPQPPRIKQVKLPSRYVANLCTVNTRGDRDFNGHGPDVKVWALAEIRNANEVWLVIRFRAVETQPDYTTGINDYAARIYVAPTGWHVKSIDSDHYSFSEYVDTDHAADAPPIQDGGFMTGLWVVGDTDGDDVGNCTTDDTRIVRLDVTSVDLTIEENAS